MSERVTNLRQERGAALISVLLATVLLLALVSVLVDLGTVRLQRATADLAGVQALGGADGGVAWFRAVLYDQHGSIDAAIAHLGTTQGKRRFTIDDHTYVVCTVSVLDASPVQTGDHTDDNVEENVQATERIVQVTSAAAVYAGGAPIARRVTETLVRVFPATPYSEVAGYIDDASPVGIDSPGDAAGQVGQPDATELLVQASIFKAGSWQDVSQFGDTIWSDNNTSSGGALP